MKEVKIDLKQPKYMWAILVYIAALFVGFMVIKITNFEVAEEVDDKLKTTEYLNSDLPDAAINSEIGSKRKNVMDSFGHIRDESAIAGIESDIDSVKKKEDYSSRYSQEEQDLVAQQQAEEAAKRLKEIQQQRDVTGSDKGRGKAVMGEDDYTLPESAEQRYAEMEKELNLARGRGRKALGVEGAYAEMEAARLRDSLATATALLKQKEKEADEPTEVVKKLNDESSYFNTLSKNENESSLITAIIDEEIKAVDGSRVRLRLLDDVQIGDLYVKKGTYLYATMSGFGKQRVKGTIKSVMAGDAIHQINLQLYDTDGLEGLYVPSSTFKETVSDAASSALSQNMNLNDGSAGNNFSQWAMQGVQQSYQKISQAIGKTIKKNSVRIKYGTKVYLINGKDQKKKK